MENKRNEAFAFAVYEGLIEKRYENEYKEVFENIKGLELERSVINLIDKIKVEFYKLGKETADVIDSSNINAYVEKLLSN